MINAKILAPSTREAWLERRRLVIGASEIPALFDASPWMSHFKLSAIKGGLISDEAENDAMRRGRLLEPVAIQCIREEHPEWIVQPNVLPNLQYFVDSSNRIGATPDAFVKIPGRWGRGIIQIKSVEQSIFRKTWLDQEPPLHVGIQAAIECAITDSQYAYVAALVVGHRVDLHLQEIPLTSGLYAAAAARSLAFWEKIDAGETYAPDFDKDVETIREIYADSSPDKEIDLSQDNEVSELAENDRILSGIDKDTKGARAEIKARMLSKMKDAEVARFRGEIIATAKTVHRKGYEVKPSSTRQLRFKENHE
jgi:predicted phage-related endonuclease